MSNGQHEGRRSRGGFVSPPPSTSPEDSEWSVARTTLMSRPSPPALSLCTNAAPSGSEKRVSQHYSPSAGYRYQQHIHHFATVPSVSSTPRVGVTPRRVVSSPPPQPDLIPAFARPPVDDFFVEGLPEGLLNSEQSLTVSFSAAPSRTNDAVPVVGCLDLSSTDALLFGDILGRVVVYDNDRHRRLVQKHSHQGFLAEFDCLKSVHVNESIRSVRFINPPRCPGVTSYLAANERTVKLYRVRDSNPLQPKRSVVPARAFTGPHQFPVHTVSLCADAETFLTADDFQVFWWNLEAEDTTRAACISDIKPVSMDAIDELLTAASFHPTHGSLFLTASSSGAVCVGDLRDPPCRHPRRYSMRLQLQAQHNSFQCEHDDILVSVSDALFMNDTTVITRDYLSLKQWDLRYPTKQTRTAMVMSHVTPHISVLYDNDSIFDRFTIAADPDTGVVATGLYDGMVAVWRSQAPSADDSSPDSDVEYYRADFDNACSSSGRVPKPPLVPDEDASVVCLNKVLAVAIGSGARRFACAIADHVFVFDRSMDAAVTSPLPSSPAGSRRASEVSDSAF